MTSFAGLDQLSAAWRHFAVVKPYEKPLPTLLLGRFDVHWCLSAENKEKGMQMASSYSQTETVTCPNCQHVWQAELWLIVDADERPDLIAQARSGTLQSLQCPNCTAELHLNVPLLLFRPDSTLPLAFFPAAEQTDGATENEAQFLVNTLYERLGSSRWQDDWLAGGLPSLSRTLLPILLDTPPQQAHLLHLIDRFSRVAAWRDVRAFIGENPAMLHEEVDNLYGQIIAEAERHGGSGAADYIADRDLLRRCRAEGVSQVLFDLTEPLPPPLAEQVDAAQEVVEAFDAGSTTEVSALSQAIAVFEEVRQDPRFGAAGANSRGSVLQNLGISLLKRYRLEWTPQDLDDAIRHLEAAVQTTPKAAFTSYALTQRTLAQAYEERYQLTSYATELDRAIAAHQAAAETVAADPAYLPEHLNSYARLLRERYGRSGSLDDLQQAIGAWQHLIGLLDDTSPRVADYLNNLANAYRELYRRNDSVHLLREAVALHRHVVELRPDDPSAHNNLANAYMDEFRRHGYARELEKAIAGYREALRLAEAAGEAANYRHNLAKALRQRAILNEDAAELLEAVRILMPLIEQTPEDSPNYPSLLHTLGTFMRSLHEASGDETYLQGGIAAYEDAARLGLERDMDLVLISVAPDWGAWAAARASWQEAARAYAYGLQASEQLYRMQLGRTARELWLRDAQRLPGLGAYALAKAGDYTGAVLMLERGRTRLLGEALRRDPENLARLRQGAHRPLYQQYIDLIQQIESLELKHGQGDGKVSVTLRRLRDQLDELIDAIQQLPEFHDFLREPSWEEVQAALTAPPAGEQRQAIGVYIAVTSFGGLALLVHNQGIEPVWLEMDSEALEHLLRGAFEEVDEQETLAKSAEIEALISEQLPPDWRIERVSPVVRPESDTIAGGYLGGQLGSSELQVAIVQTLEEIGAQIVQPIAKELAHIANDEDGSPPTLVLIPTGKLGLLPLQAAPYHFQGKRRILLDHYAIAFAPSAEVLSICRRRVQDRTQARSLLTVIDPTQTLAYAALEGKIVALHFHGETVTVLAGEGATKPTTAAHVSGHGYLHFACHGFYDWDRVMNGGLVLAGADVEAVTARLTLADILEPSFMLDDSRLAVLSACETGLSEFQRAPEEDIGLPAGFLQAGVPAVISTLWAVNDLSTALLMEQFYQEHLAEGMEPAAALRRAQLWLRDVTAGELATYFAEKRREGGEHVRQLSAAWRRFAALEPAEKPFAHPYYWAAFTLTGA